mmetsp:Transcript_9976/g.37200  ORF Transcript_9976/g.37200 Transcript_9976/m.37200 type:complete len:84 (-) Transcript_9976:37-288(-)
MTVLFLGNVPRSHLNVLVRHHPCFSPSNSTLVCCGDLVFCTTNLIDTFIENIQPRTFQMIPHLSTFILSLLFPSLSLTTTGIP